jgi:uncharacterized membrane protein YsdA (DUF1294 family)
MIDFFIQLPLLTQIIIGYFVFINILTFFYFGIDKIKARGGKRRVSEKKLWILSLIGGSIGALLGMHYFRHKTKKISFQFILALVIFIQLGIAYLLFFK